MRYGTKFTVQDHDSITWRCLACITHRQAENIRNLAYQQGKSVHAFLTVPPADAHGPAPEVVDKFIVYLEALHREDDKRAKELLHELKAEKRTPKSPANKVRSTDLHELDAQIKEDIEMLRLQFPVDDLKSLCIHHNLVEGGTRDDVQERLMDFYNQAMPKQQSAPKKAKTK